MTLRAATLLACLPVAVAALPAAAETVAEQAARASADLQKAVAALQQATGAHDRVTALTTTIRAYENGLAALREAMRQAELREASLSLQLNAKRERVGQLLGILAQMEKDPGPLLLLHPDGPLGTVRSGMMLADVTPGIEAELDQLRGQLSELRDLRTLQAAAGQTLAGGLQSAQDARTALSQAISDRTELPRRYTEDGEAMKALLQSADTLEAFAMGLASGVPDSSGFATQMGRLPLPVLGTLIRRPNEADGAGIRHPGMALATRPAALVTAPMAATIRYRGPLLDYGNVMILEPGGNYLLILAGLGTVYGEVGEVVAPGAPLGLMPGGGAGDADLLSGGQDDGGASDTETLYLELRQGAEPVDPTEWFAATTG